MLAFLGGTGPEGRGLALRLALAGEEVVLGSRDVAKAQEAAAKVRALAPSARVRGADNATAAREGDVVFLTVPYTAQASLLGEVGAQLRGKVVVDTVVPLEFVGGRPRALSVPEGSAAQQAQALLPGAKVVAAFHNVSAQDLLVPDKAIEGDVLVCADDAEAKTQVRALAGRIQRIRGVDGGGLENARYVEELTVLLLSLNRIHKARTMVRIHGI